MPARHLILPKSFGCLQTAPKVSRAAGNSKNYEKWSEILILVELLTFMKCWVCQHFALHFLVRINGPPTRRKAPALQGTRKTTKKGQKS